MSKTIEIFVSSRFYEFKELREKIKKERFSKLDVGLTLNMLDDRDGIADVRSPTIASIEGASGSDVVILLLGESYKEELNDEKSYTHKEYDSAIKKGLKILAFPIGDCYNPNKLRLSEHPLFRKFQENNLYNIYHIIAPYTPSHYDVDEMYEKIYQSLKNYIQSLIDKGMIDEHTRNLNSKVLQWSSLVVASTIIGLWGISSLYHKENTVTQQVTHEKLDTILKDLKIYGNKEQFLQAYFGNDWQRVLQNPQTYQNLKLKLSDSSKTTHVLLAEKKELLEKIKSKQLKGSIQKMIDNAFIELRYDDIRDWLDNFIKTNQAMGDDLIKAHYQKALTYIEELKYHKAKAVFEEFIPSGIKDIAILTQYGLLYNTLGEYDKAIEFHNKALNIQLRTLGEKHPSTTASYNNIGRTWANKGEYDKAIVFNNRALKIQLITLEKNHHLTATSYHNIGIAWQNKGDHNKAIELYNKALKIRLSTLGETHLSTAMTYNNIGVLWYDKMDYDKAMKFYKKAVNIRHSILGTKHPLIAASYNNIGSLWYMKDDYDKAIEFYKRALKIQIATLGENHPSTIISYDNIILTKQSKKEYDQMIKFYDKNLKITIATLGEKHLQTATYYNQIAMAWYSKGKYDKAYLYTKKAVKIWELKVPASHPNLIRAKKSLKGIEKELK